MSIFADCHPRGIASDGKYLWSACYSGLTLDTKIDQREIKDREYEMNQTRTFVAALKHLDPSGLSYADKHIWLYNRLDQKMMKITFPGKKDDM